MKSLSLKLPDALDRRLDSAVARRGVTKSVLVREALERYLDSSETAETGSILVLAGDLVGCIEGPRDLSSNPKYLDGLGR
ncbi:MAG: ribbon-helix-helix protein, CopG family [Gammaproteobacteria bacterium]